MDKRDDSKPAVASKQASVRVRRVALGVNAVAAIVLAGGLAVLVNLIAARYYDRWDVGRDRPSELAPKTRSVLAGTKGTVRVTVCFSQGHPHFETIKLMLKAYAHAMRENREGALTLEFVDPNRDLVRIRELKASYDIGDENVVVFELDGRRRYVSEADMVSYDTRLDDRRVVRSLKDIPAERAFTAALHSVGQGPTPVVYLVTGHGEHDVEDFDGSTGYAGIARIMRHDNLEVRPLGAAAGGIPDDAAAVVIAGPRHQLLEEEVGWIRDYLGRNGRVMALLNPGVASGLEALLADWGVAVRNATVVGVPLSSQALIVSDYGQHRATRHVRGMSTVFYRPRVVEPIATDGVPGADKPVVTTLALSSARGWAESDVTQQPPRFDEDADRPGPISVAVASERGGAPGLNVELSPTRLVVMGDSYLVSNGALESAVGANAEFFMGALNWLLERDELLAIAPRQPGVLRLQLSRKRVNWLFGLASGLLPALVGMAGVVTWWIRRR